MPESVRQDVRIHGDAALPDVKSSVPDKSSPRSKIQEIRQIFRPFPAASFLLQQLFNAALRPTGPAPGGILNPVATVIIPLTPLAGLPELAMEPFRSIVRTRRRIPPPLPIRPGREAGESMRGSRPGRPLLDSMKLRKRLPGNGSNIPRLQPIRPNRSLLADRGSLGRLFRRRKRLRLPWL